MEKNIPKRRFKEFIGSGDWEEKKLGEVSTLTSSKRIHQGEYKDHGIPFFRGLEISKLGSSKIINDLTYISKEHYEKIKSIYGVPTIDDILITAVGTIGNTYIIKNRSPFYFKDGNLIWIKDIKISSNYLNIYLGNGVGKKRVYASASGSNQKALTMERLFNISIYIPSLAEQEKIGNFFQKLDRLIEINREKLGKLKASKSAYLTEMFPGEGEDRPRRRFQGFTGEWEEKKLGEVICLTKTGTNLLGSQEITSRPLLKMGNIQRGYFSFNKLEYLKDDVEIEEDSIIQYGDFVFNTRNTLELVGKGATWMREGNKFIFNNNIAKVTFKDVDTIFFNYLYNTTNTIKKVQSKAVGTTSVAAIYPRDLNMIEVRLPSLPEQEKIGNFFKKLDHQIEVQEEKLEKLEKMKKAYLAEMFV